MNERSGAAEAYYNGPALLHVGYPKCASTTLQKQMFHEDVLGADLAAGQDNFAAIFDLLALSNGYLFDPEQADATMASLEEPVRQRGLMPVWSAESLIGSDAKPHNGPLVLGRVARLRRPLRVLMVIREQRKLAYSGFQQYVRGGGMRGLREYIGTGREPLARYPILRCDYLHYEHAVSAWQTALGTENVLVLPMERLIEDPAGFTAAIARFAGRVSPDIPKVERDNTGLGPVAVSIQRLANRFVLTNQVEARRSKLFRNIARTLRIVDRLIPVALDRPVERRWRARIQRRYEGEFRDGNRILERLIETDLKRYGYQ